MSVSRTLDWPVSRRLGCWQEFVKCKKHVRTSNFTILKGGGPQPQSKSTVMHFKEFLSDKKNQFSGEKLSFIGKFHSVFEKILSFQNLRFFYGSVLHISADRNATLGVLTLSVAKNREKLSFSRISGSVSAKNWVSVKKLSFFRIQFRPDRAKKKPAYFYLLKY